MTTAGTIIVAGSLAQRPGHGGHAWVFLQYLLGFRRLGWDVLFLDELPPEACVDEAGQPCPFGRSWNLRYFLDVMAAFGLDASFSLACGDETAGLPRPQVLERVRRSAFLLNVMGFLADPEVRAAAPRRVFLDIDPGFGQMWRALGLADVFAGHDDFVTIGRNVGRPGCDVPTCGLAWVTTPQPIVLEHWPVDPPAGRGRQGGDGNGGGAFTSVVSWRGPFGPIDYNGRTYGLRVHEFRKFVALPRVTGRRFELAIDIDASADARDVALLDENGWVRVDPRAVAGTPDAYRRHVAASRAELMVAKNLYVDTRGGWFSDRSICYLATGRPVLAQDTGLSGHYPTGQGLLTFATLDEAAAGVAAIDADYLRHCRFARQVAEACFDSDEVLGRLLVNLGVR